MPGLHLIYDLNCNIIVNKMRISNAVDSCLHFPNYSKSILFSEKPYIVMTTKYESYPVKSFQDEKYFYYLEGNIYNKNLDTLWLEFNTIGNLVFNKKSFDSQRIKKCLHNYDGDYIILIIDKQSKELILLNDFLGRLPLYFYKKADKLILSRDIKFVTNLIDNILLKKLSIAEYLLFGYCLGDKTLFESIKRFEPASILKISPIHNKVELKNFHIYNFDNKEFLDENIDKVAEKLHDYFIEACDNRHHKNSNNLVSLSGGLDSRSVAAGLKKLNKPFQCVTYLNYDNRERIDVKVANSIAKSLKVNWKLFNLISQDIKDYVMLLNLKYGLNYLPMGFITQFFTQLNEYFKENIIYFTGDGGGRLLRDLRPQKKIDSVTKLINYILANNQIFTLAEISKMLNISTKSIINEITQQVQKYPETDFCQKYVHFLVYERGVNWNFEGEDRNRCFFWSVTPFYSTFFFDYVFKCNENYKTYYNLYKTFLNKLNPNILSIPDANYNLPITSYRFKLRALIKSFFNTLPLEVQQKLRKIVVKKNIPNHDDLVALKCLEKQLLNNKLLDEYFSIKYTKNLLRKKNKIALETLLTITTVINIVYSNDTNLT